MSSFRNRYKGIGYGNVFSFIDWCNNYNLSFIQTYNFICKIKNV